MDWIGDAITAGGHVVSGAINALMQARTNAQNRKQAEYAFQQQQAAIQRQNEYNSPGNQVLRMASAGLNPSLAYGADGAMVGNQADVPAYSAIPAESPNIGDIGAGLADAVRTGVEVRDFEVRKNLATAEMALKDAQTFLAVTQGDLNSASKEEILTLLGYKVENLESETQLNWERVLETRQMISNLRAQKDEILSRIGLNEEQIKLVAAQVGLTEMQAFRIAQLLPHEILNMDADTALKDMNGLLSESQIYSIGRDIRHIDFIEGLERDKFNFEKDSWGIEQKKWDAEMTQNRRLNMLDNFTRIITFGIGLNAVKHGGYLPPKTVRNSVGHHGAGSSYNPPSTPTFMSGKDRYREWVKRERLGR